MHNGPVYALDFDGVICDSAIETGLTGWKVAGQLWQDMPSETPAEMIELFRSVRPVMETGFEAVLIMRLLFEGMPAETLLHHFSASITTIIERENLAVSQLKKLFGETRDQWIDNNLNEWIEMNPLFEGITNKLNKINPEQCYIITTKQERFVSQIFEANSIKIPAEQIFGLDRNMSKQQILADLLIEHPLQTILFVEDRLPTLINVIEDSRLNDVRLFFAAWGYNTIADKQLAAKLAMVTTINLDQMLNL